MRRRWQDATQRSEGIAADVHESTSPLLRQIRALQEEGRARAQAWAQAEQSFVDRAATAEEAARAAEASRQRAEERAASGAAECRAQEQAGRELKSQLAVATAEARASGARQVAAEDRAVEAEAEAEALKEQVRRAGRDLKAAQAKHKLQAEEVREALESAKIEGGSEKDALEAQAAHLSADLDDARRRLGHHGGGSGGGSSSSSHSLPATPVRGDNATTPTTPRSATAGKGGGEVSSNNGGDGGDGSSNSDDHLSSDNEMFGLQPGHQPGTMMMGGIHHIGPGGMLMGGVTASSGGGSGGVGGGGGFVVQLEKLHLTVKQREAECAASRQRCGQVEAVCDALTSEVQELSRRHGELEAVAAEAPRLKKQNTKLTQKNNVLLELLGEKTEELEDIQQRLDKVTSSSAIASPGP